MNAALHARAASALARLRPLCGDEDAAHAMARLESLFGESTPLPSRLTAEGVPLEFTFRANDTALAFTADVREEWIGTRIRGGAVATKRYALAADEASARAAAEARLGARVPVGRCRMLAAGEGTFEAYFRADRIAPWALRILLAPLSLQRLDRLLLEAFEDACAARLRDEMPGVTGFSYAIRDGAPPSFTLYAFASSMFGGDARTRAALLRCARRRGVSLEAYARFTEPLAGRRGPASTHGLFGVAVDERGLPEMRIGCTPPRN